MAYHGQALYTFMAAAISTTHTAGERAITAVAWHISYITWKLVLSRTSSSMIQDCGLGEGSGPPHLGQE